MKYVSMSLTSAGITDESWSESPIFERLVPLISFKRGTGIYFQDSGAIERSFTKSADPQPVISKMLSDELGVCGVVAPMGSLRDVVIFTLEHPDFAFSRLYAPVAAFGVVVLKNSREKTILMLAGELDSVILEFGAETAPLQFQLSKHSYELSLKRKVSARDYEIIP